MVMQDRIDELESRLSDVEARLSAIEDASAEASSPSGAAPEPSLGNGFISDASTHIGRVLLIFGGAYLLRAITEYQFVPVGIGISLGASYALLWLFMAYRKAAVPDSRANAPFYGGTSVLLALPLLVEAISRFELLSGPQGVAALTVFSVLALGVAASRRLRSLAWFVVGGGIVTAFAVMIAARSAVALSVFLLLLGLGSLWAVYWRGWMGTQWLGALGANVGVVALIVVSGSDQWSVEPRTALLLAAALFLTYIMSFVARSHLQGRELGFFEAVQVLVSISIAYWAAVASAGQYVLLMIGVPAIAVGGFCYGLAFVSAARGVRGRNYYYYSSLGLLLVITGTSAVMPPTWAATLWSLMALTMAWFSGRTGWVALSLQCTFLLLAAGVMSGLLATGWHALTGEASVGWPPLVPGHLGIALTTVICLFLPVAQHSERWGVMAGMPQLIVLALSVWEVGGLMVLIAATLLAGAGGAEPNLAIVAALRTAVLATSSVTLALSSRFRRWPEARWLVYPVLILVGVKLFIEDFPHGQPETLFVALAFVGGALILVAKLLRKEPPAAVLQAD